MSWININEQLPLPGDKIIAKLNDCKVAKFIYMEIREGEGLGHIDSWRFAPDWESITKECPKLYFLSKCFECGDGWFDLIRELSLKLEELINKYPYKKDEDLPAFYVCHVKEKYGTLRFYMGCSTDEMKDLIDVYTDKSATVCECCGEPGKLYSEGWCEVRCDTCRQN